MTLDAKGVTERLLKLELLDPTDEDIASVRQTAAYLSAVPSDVAGLVERSRDEWRYDIQYGPEGEANYAWVYSGKEMVATCKTHHAIAIVNAMNDATALSALASRPHPNETLERAAKACDRIDDECGMEAGLGASCAAAIRQLKEPE